MILMILMYLIDKKKQLKQFIMIRENN